MNALSKTSLDRLVKDEFSIKTLSSTKDNSVKRVKGEDRNVVSFYGVSNKDNNLALGYAIIPENDDEKSQGKDFITIYNIPSEMNGLVCPWRAEKMVSKTQILREGMLELFLNASQLKPKSQKFVEEAGEYIGNKNIELIRNSYPTPEDLCSMISEMPEQIHQCKNFIGELKTEMIRNPEIAHSYVIATLLNQKDLWDEMAMTIDQEFKKSGISKKQNDSIEKIARVIYSVNRLK